MKYKPDRRIKSWSRVR